MNTTTQNSLLTQLRHPYVVPSTIDDELEWFFQRSEEDCRDGKPWDPERRWSTIAHRVVGNWLAGIDRYDAEILRVAYATDPCPQNLQQRLGRVTTVVVRLAALDAGWPLELEEQKALERRTAMRLAWQFTVRGPSVLRPYVPSAVALLRTAVRAYGQQRKGGPSMTGRISTLPEFKKTKEDS